MARTAPEAAAPDWAQTAEQQVLDAALKIVAHEGWTSRLATLAGKACGLSAGETELLLPHGAADLAALLSRRHDAAALAALAAVDPSALKIRERIARGVEARVAAAAADEAAVRRLTGFLALPSNLSLGARLAWESADALWRWAGDTATDENHYSKRALLAGILTGAIAIRLTSGPAAALAFTDRRIANVMTFEKWKATTRLKPAAMMDSLARALGHLRYGAER
ncbi:MAG TPA: COQ9 family protein [Phenylobacterium sp.]|jgi:ubiquinone biosynthesis protein COQ9|uniref:COQ9 family protein n=1 Tax=Phenylobacterium sp. TaxID=1871053 RepID=UPI002C0EB2AF|nr:COQ9 family protein [Phenylobacterium sp.]HXA37788.1 COQ9 family protein [Phenylobacterium sp.]